MLGIIGEASFPLPLGHFEDIVISFIGDKIGLLILLCGMHRLLCLFFSVMEYLEISVVIW